MKDEYYSLRGWDVETGLPLRSTLEGLGMGDVAEVLKKHKGLGPEKEGT